MEETNNTASGQTPQGKGMGVAGFVISLVALVLFWIVSPMALFSAIAGGGMGIAGFWLVLSILGTLLSVMGMMKLGKTGGKKGLATTGMILGIIAVLLSAWLIMGVNKVHKEAGDVGKELLEKMGEGMKEGMEQALDSLKSGLDEIAPADSTAH
jgi:hypothetical protein